MWSRLRPVRQNISVDNTIKGQVIIQTGSGELHINRPIFKIDDSWFADKLLVSFDVEIKSKFIPRIHQDNDFERKQLLDIIDFKAYRARCFRYVGSAQEALAHFESLRNALFNALQAEGVNMHNDDRHPFKTAIELTFQELPEIRKTINELQRLLHVSDYGLLYQRDQLKPIVFTASKTIQMLRNDWTNILDKPLKDSFQLMSLASAHDHLHRELSDVNTVLDKMIAGFNGKIIAGPAGAGKTHMSALLIEKIKANGDLVLFFKAKQFSGNQIDLETALLRLLGVPEGYRFDELMELLNEYARQNGRRCVLIIDALNETTKSTIGFSEIWKNHLQTLINKFTLHSNLYLVCTLRTSYISDIWDIRPARIAELSGFTNHDDILKACEKYFDYYMIEPTNLYTADVRLFAKPLLLDLFCKLINHDRKETKKIVLDTRTYLSVFEDYTDHLAKEVKKKLSLARGEPIYAGLRESSSKFFESNEAILTLDDYTIAFDKDPQVKIENSIAFAVLESYLLFIKDSDGKSEFVKHTQQEVGGYLLAKMLSDKYKNLEDLLKDTYLTERIIGDNDALHHQLRLDILKFLIALRPELIPRLTDQSSVELAWWYMYNGHDGHDPSIAAHLKATTSPELVVASALPASSAKWLDASAPANFHLITELLAGFKMWDFDTSWTFYVHLNKYEFSNFVENQIERILKEELLSEDEEKLVLRVMAFITATTVRELRDLATAYLVESGKKFPYLLIELAEYTAGLPDSYIFERVIAANYGVALIQQNDPGFVKGILLQVTERITKLCFPEDKPAPSINYMVLDSVKHLAALAVHKRVLKELPQFDLDIDFWLPPTQDQYRLFEESSEMNPPNPIGMDFGIYTIPRLVNDDKNTDEEARVQVYKRIYEIGYRDLTRDDINDERFREFLSGNYGSSEGKIDRLGKKYSWKGFLDYAGVLLLQGKLPADEGDTEESVYQRISDVDIDISMPMTDNSLPLRVYRGNLLSERATNSEWYLTDKTGILNPYLELDIEGVPYILLHSNIDEKGDKEYKIRSYVLAEAHLIGKNADIDRLQPLMDIGQEEWENDIHYSPDYIRHTYFGELYWADTIAIRPIEQISISTGQTINVKRNINIRDALSRGFSFEDIGKEIEESRDEQLYFESEPALAEYLWETDSKTFDSRHEYVPSIKLAKFFEFKAEPKTGRILDADGKQCFQHIKYQDETTTNECYYLRADLMKQYLDEKNLAILYQVKQHSYDNDYHGKRFMRYLLVE